MTGTSLNDPKRVVWAFGTFCFLLYGFLCTNYLFLGSIYLPKPRFLFGWLAGATTDPNDAKPLVWVLGELFFISNGFFVLTIDF